MEKIKLTILKPFKNQFNLVLHKQIYGKNILIFNTKKNISDRLFTFELNIDKHTRFFQLEMDIEKLSPFIKDGIEYYQQIYLYDDINTEVILRFCKNLKLKEVVYKY